MPAKASRLLYTMIIQQRYCCRGIPKVIYEVSYLESP